jgi:hypothetical protein
MVHRDPETGQFLAHADDEPVELTYADHEFLNFRIATITGTGSGTANETVSTEYAIEDDVLDLENDELAMLSWMNASLSAFHRQFPESSGDVTRGGGIVNVEIGANLSGSEYLSQSPQNTGVQIIENDSESIQLSLDADDDPGLWGALNVTVQSGFKDTDADGTFSGNAVSDNDRLRRVFSEETSGGPYIDSTDDVSVGIYVDKEGDITDLRSTVYGQMAFLVFEYENRRAEFAPYDPGPSMD